MRSVVEFHPCTLFSTLAVCAISLGSTVGVPSTALGQSGNEGSILLTIENVEEPEGALRCTLHTRETWLDTEDGLIRREGTFTGAKTGECRFRTVEPGTYGIAVYHDRDGDGEMDTNLLGIPSEGVCASRDPEASFGSPGFDGAQFEHDSGETRVECDMRY